MLAFDSQWDSAVGRSASPVPTPPSKASSVPVPSVWQIQSNSCVFCLGIRNLKSCDVFFFFNFLTNSWYSWPQNYIKLLCCLQNCMTKSQHESKNIHPCPKIRGHGTQQHVSWFSVRGPAEATTRNPGFGCGNLPPSRCHQQVDVCMPLPGAWKQRIWQLETYGKIR